MHFLHLNFCKPIWYVVIEVWTEALQHRPISVFQVVIFNYFFALLIRRRLEESRSHPLSQQWVIVKMLVVCKEPHISPFLWAGSTQPQIWCGKVWVTYSNRSTTSRIVCNSLPCSTRKVLKNSHHLKKVIRSRLSSSIKAKRRDKKLPWLFVPQKNVTVILWLLQQWLDQVNVAMVYGAKRLKKWRNNAKILQKYLFSYWTSDTDKTLSGL